MGRDGCGFSGTRMTGICILLSCRKNGYTNGMWRRPFPPATVHCIIDRPLLMNTTFHGSGVSLTWRCDIWREALEEDLLEEILVHAELRIRPAQPLLLVLLERDLWKAGKGANDHNDTRSLAP
jgi:hypothetical protein